MFFTLYGKLELKEIGARAHQIPLVLLDPKNENKRAFQGSFKKSPKHARE